MLTLLKTALNIFQVNMYVFDYALCYLILFTLERIILFNFCYSYSHLAPVYTKRTKSISLILNY